jgi:hypothetical protein
VGEFPDSAKDPGTRNSPEEEEEEENGKLMSRKK